MNQQFRNNRVVNRQPDIQADYSATAITSLTSAMVVAQKNAVKSFAETQEGYTQESADALVQSVNKVVSNVLEAKKDLKSCVPILSDLSQVIADINKLKIPAADKDNLITQNVVKVLPHMVSNLSANKDFLDYITKTSTEAIDNMPAHLKSSIIDLYGGSSDDSDIRRIFNAGVSDLETFLVLFKMVLEVVSEGRNSNNYCIVAASGLFRSMKNIHMAICYLVSPQHKLDFDRFRDNEVAAIYRFYGQGRGNIKSAPELSALYEAGNLLNEHYPGWASLAGFMGTTRWDFCIIGAKLLISAPTSETSAVFIAGMANKFFDSLTDDAKTALELLSSSLSTYDPVGVGGENMPLHDVMFAQMMDEEGKKKKKSKHQ